MFDKFLHRYACLWEQIKKNYNSSTNKNCFKPVFDFLFFLLCQFCYILCNMRYCYSLKVVFETNLIGLVTILIVQWGATPLHLC